MEVISMARFLMLYKSISNENLCKLTHKDVDVLFPDLKRTSFEHIRKDPYLVLSGRVVIVDDGRNKYPYFVPETQDLTDELSYVDVEYEEKSHEPYDFEKMKNYELKQVCKNSKNSKRDKHKAKKELVDRGVVLRKKYKREKFRYEGEE